MAIRKELRDELLDGYQAPTDLLGQQGILQQLTKALIERVLEGELTHHPGDEKHAAASKGSYGIYIGAESATFLRTSSDKQSIRPAFTMRS